MVTKQQNQMKRLLVFTGGFPPEIGGMEKHVYEVSKRLVKNGFDIEVITCNTERAATFEHIDGFVVYRLPSWNMLGGRYPVPRFSLTTIRILWRVFRRNYDCILTHTRFYLTSLLGLIFAKLKRIPLVHVEHGPGHISDLNIVVELINKVYDHSLGSLVVKNASKRVAVSSKVSEFLEHLGAKDAVTIPNGVDLNKFVKKKTKRPAELGNVTTITFTGRLVYLKGVQDLIKAFLEVKKRIGNTKLLIVGDGPYRPELEALAGRKRPDIIFLGDKTEEELINILNITDIFVLPSWGESFGISMVEAGVMGIPILASDGGANKEIIRNLETGLLFSAGDVETLKEGLCRLIVDKELREQLGERAKEDFRAKFDWDKVAEEWARELSLVMAKE